MNELTVTFGNQRVVLRPGQNVYIGRQHDSAVVIDDLRVSRQHVRLSWGPQGGWVLENLGHSGTFVSGQRVTQLYLTHAVEARLVAPDGPTVLFEPAAAPATQAAAAAGRPHVGAQAPQMAPGGVAQPPGCRIRLPI